MFEEKASGGRWDRPELHRLLDHLRDGDVVVVWKLDRLSRSLKDLLHIMEKIGEAGAGFRSLTEHIDTTTPAGRMMMQMVGAVAEFERAMIRERTSAGLAAARAEGRIGGRRKKLDDTKRREIAEAVVKMPADTGEEQGTSRGRFQRGQSGNPAGRRPGARNRTCALALRLMDADAEPVILALIKAAKNGDVAAIKLVLERVAPLPRNRPVQFSMPPIETSADLGPALAAILRAASDGEMSPDEATAFASLVESRRRQIETIELEARIAALEQSREPPG